MDGYDEINFGRYIASFGYNLSYMEYIWLNKIINHSFQKLMNDHEIQEVEAVIYDIVSRCIRCCR